MVAGRRAVSIHQPRRWVFNRMADVYGARPPYPGALTDALAECCGPGGGRVIDVGAGVGHVALPLATRGFQVTALDPAAEMLVRLRDEAAARGLSINVVHGAAEALPLGSASVDLAVVADALHFFDVERSGSELCRVLDPRGALAVVSCEFADTPFMRAVADLMARSAPRRRREHARATVQLFALSGVRVEREECFEDATPVDADRLELILRSISFIGPAMNPTRAAAFSRELRALPGPRVWARRFCLRAGRRRR